MGEPFPMRQARDLFRHRLVPNAPGSVDGKIGPLCGWKKGEAVWGLDGEPECEAGVDCPACLRVIRGEVA